MIQRKQRQAFAHRQGFVQLFFVLHEQHGGGRVAAQVLDLHFAVRGIDAVAHAASALHAKVGEHPFDLGIG